MEATKKEPNILQTYEELKTEFENHACRVDDLCFNLHPRLVKAFQAGTHLQTQLLLREKRRRKKSVSISLLTRVAEGDFR